jgi:hypothetical protein
VTEIIVHGPESDVVAAVKNLVGAALCSARRLDDLKGNFTGYGDFHGQPFEYEIVVSVKPTTKRGA